MNSNMKKDKNKKDNIVPYMLMVVIIMVLALLAIFIAFGGLLDYVIFKVGGGGSYIDFCKIYFVKYKDPLITAGVLGVIEILLFWRFGYLSHDKIDDDKS